MKYLLLLCGVIFLASCSPNYHNKIIGRKVSTISCSFMPASSVQGQIDSGFVNVDASHAGNPMICDSVYTIAFTTYENWHYGYPGYLSAGIIVMIAGFLTLIVITSRGNTAAWTLALAFGPLIIGGCLIGAFYYFNPYRDIKKSDYVHYIQKDGDLRNFPLNPAQAL